MAKIRAAQDPVTEPEKDPDEAPPAPNAVSGGNIHQRLNRVMMAVTFVKKHKPTGMKYAVVSHDAVTRKVRGYLIGNGVIWTVRDLHCVQNGNRTECRFTVRFTNVDEPDDYIDVPTIGYGIDEQDKGPGKSISYGVKTALLKTLGLESGEGEDPDFDQETPLRTEKQIKEVKGFDLQIEEAGDPAALDTISQQVLAAFQEGDIDRAETLRLRGVIKQRSAAFDQTPAEQETT
jgi:ERF superfamily